MTEDLAALIASGTVRQVGTFNGNPLVMAAAQATLLEVLTDEAYRALRGQERAAAGRARRRHRAPRAAVPHGRPGRQGVRRVLARAALRVPRLRHQGRRGAVDAGLAVPHEPRRVHDARRRRAVDAVGGSRRRRPAALRRRVRGLRARCDIVTLTAPFRPLQFVKHEPSTAREPPLRRPLHRPRPGDRQHAAGRAAAPVAQARRAHLGQARVAQPDRARSRTASRAR